MRRRRALLFTSGSFAAVFFVALFLVPLPQIKKPVSRVVEAKDGSVLRTFASSDGAFWRIPIDPQAAPDFLYDAVLTFEDRRFRLHPGVDPLALLRAAYTNLAAGRVVSGGSTLTMQIARMLDPRPRTFGAKLIEAFRALQLELRWSKDELLAIYLDLAPYGGNIEGIGAAALFYFDKDVSLLTLDEAAALAALPNAPAKLAASRERLRARRDDVLRRMADNGALTRARAEEAIAVPLRLERRPAPNRAPHLALRLREQAGDAARVRSSIDPELQRRAERLLAHHVAKLKTHGITAGAVVVLENESRKVRALVGSPDFFDARSSGQVDGTAALRSPGSTLKPFLYALALDRGMIGLSTGLEDVPVNFKDWSPENFDGGYRGLISAEEALKSSLNIPAVELAQALEAEGEGFNVFLRRAKLTAFQGELSRFGLSTVLGGCEVNLLELSNLYSTLAAGGKYRAPTLLENSAAAPEVELFSEGAAYLISETLTDVRRPELPDSWKDSASLPRVAWKTGTSYGRRDAWTLGYDRRYTVGVWIGNFDGSGVPELVGVHAAAPLFFALFDALPHSGGEVASRPRSVETRTVCALSGAVPGPSCAHTKKELALAVAPQKTCALHEALEVDDRTGHRLCSKCRADRARHTEVHVLWPPRVAAYFASRDLLPRTAPEHDPRCAAGLQGDRPKIASPLDGDVYLLRDGVARELQKIALVAAPAGGAGRIYWFVGGRLSGEAPAGSAVEWTPEPGRHRIVAVDEEGRSSEIEIRVRSDMLTAP